MPSKILPLPPLSRMLETNKWRHFINLLNSFNNQSIKTTTGLTPSHLQECLQLNKHPNRPNITEDNHGNKPLGLDHGNQPLGLGLPPQRKTGRPHQIPPDSVTSPRVARIHRQPVTPSPRVEQPPGYQTRRYNLRPNTISARYVDAANYIAIKEANSVTQPITGQSQEYRHLMKGDNIDTWETSFANELG